MKIDATTYRKLDTAQKLVIDRNILARVRRGASVKCSARFGWQVADAIVARQQARMADLGIV